MAKGYQSVVQDLLSQRKQDLADYSRNLVDVEAKQASVYSTFHQQSAEGLQDIKNCLGARIRELEQRLAFVRA
jgi:hypothetical protein